MKALLTTATPSLRQVVSFSEVLQPSIAPAEQPLTAGRRTCLCCSDVLLRHVRSGEVYWRCGNCHQEMPARATRHMED